MPRERPHGSHVISPSAIGPSKVRAESITDPRRSGPVRPQPRQLGVRGPEGLLSGNSGPYLDSWGSEAQSVCYLGTVALTSTAGGQRPQGSAIWEQWPLPRQLGVRGPKGLLSGNSGPYLNSRKGRKPQGSSD
ncbi:hypothetical protein PanWU01x14_356780 [Parasponia andersonii]|uniref:Uncharacterized protein n=1 Tax=Parasponia andersonii TaxID=3476 RepID=A0A2P5A8U6_PARAD|nr:hypothetical protein PanWU01x14_356780 [Parasponia andersonii]